MILACELPLPLVQILFQRSGHIGYLCGHVGDKCGALEERTGEMDAAVRHRATVREHFPHNG